VIKVNQKQRDAFMAACKGYTAHQVSIAMNKQTPGINWRKCSKGHMADSYAAAGQYIVHASAKKISLKQLAADLENPEANRGW
jgi:ribosomal protein L44E